MPSVLIGRTRCPECGFEHAHVKRSEKTTYRYCPEHDCGAQYFPRGQKATDRLVASMRPLEATGSGPAASPAPSTLASSGEQVRIAGAGDTGSSGDAAPPPPPPPPSPPVPERKRLPSFFR